MRFNFTIEDENGEVVGEDWCFFDMADFRDTGVESIEIHIYSALRAIKREQERRNWQEELDRLYATEDAE